LITFDTFAGGIKTNTLSYTGSSQTGGTSGAISGTANGFYFTLLISSTDPTSSSPLNSAWAQATYNGAGLIGVNYTGLAGDAEGPNGTGSTAIGNWAAGATEFYEIVGWSASLGTTWSQVSSELASGFTGLSGYFGNSSVASGISGTPPTGTPLNVFNGAGALTLYTVATPEPGTMALAGLGIAGLVALRRKK